MSVDAFRIENFMAFEDTGWIELRKINLLLGRNSSGKSAIIRALRLLKQSLLNERRQLAMPEDKRAIRMEQPLTFVIDGGVDLGSFGAIVHRKSSSPEPSVALASDEGEKGAAEFYGESSANEEAAEKGEDLNAMDERRQYSDQVTFSYRGEITLQNWEETTRAAFFALLEEPDRQADEPLIFHVSASYRQHKAQRSQENPDGQIYLWKLEFGISESLTADDATLIWSYGIDDVKFDSQRGGYHPSIRFFSRLPDEIEPSLGRIFSVSRYTSFLPEVSINLPPGSLSEFELLFPQFEAVASFWQICRAQITDWLESIVHVGPIRPLPQRSYALTEEYRRAMEIGGWQAFLSYLRRNDDRGDGKVNYWLEKLGPGKKLKRYPMMKPEYEYELYAVKLRLDETGNGDERDITDMGFGASQILPVIVQCLSAAPDALVLIERPELHLHPEAQAVVADMFIESVNDTIASRLEIHRRQLGEDAKAAQEDEKRVPVTRRYLIETHSEPLLYTTQMRVAETTVEQRSGGKYLAGGDGRFSLPHVECRFIYVRRDENPSFIEFIRLDELGEPKHPSKAFQNFFRASYDQIRAQEGFIKKLREMGGSNETRD